MTPNKEELMLDEINQRVKPPFDEAILLGQCLKYNFLCDKLIRENKALQSKLRIAEKALEKMIDYGKPLETPKVYYVLDKYNELAKDALGKIKEIK